MSKKAVVTKNKNVMNIPVPIEFVESLQEIVTELIKQALEKLDAPEDVIRLFESLDNLWNYQYFALTTPDFLTIEKGDPMRFESEDYVIEAINLIAKVGGVFPGAGTISKPRSGAFLADKQNGADFLKN